MKLKRKVLELLAEAATAAEFERSPAFLRFLDAYPDARKYADFMARAERRGGDRARRYHLYVQWQADAQLRALSERAESRGLTWYVDYTVGVAPHSFDVWAHPEIFARGAMVGCPPDEGFTSGQNWGFPPLHPDRLRESGYAYLIAALRNHFRYARALRVDHVMGLHRLYCIPEGRATGGAYVTYPAEEQYAILSVEAHRRGAWVVGENLGTVSPEVPSAMRRHGLRGLYVLQHELSTGDREFDAVPTDAVASINTHDMPTFDAFWAGRDIGQRIALGLLKGPVSAHEVADRPEERAALVDHLRRNGLLDPETEPDVGLVYRAACEFLAGSPAPMTIFNLEDFWLEPDPQNTPGTRDHPPNWRRKLRYAFEEFEGMPEVVDELRRIDERRRAARPEG
jgi:4-alpha-glucanotransferase